MMDCDAPIPAEEPFTKPPNGSWGHSPSLQKGRPYLHVGGERRLSSRSRQRGFTLIELLFVVLLLGTVMTVIMACFEGGLRVYDRVSGVGNSEMDAYLAGETLSRDLVNAIQADQLPLTGDPQAMEFLTVATVGENAGKLLQVRYEADGSGLMRLATTPDSVEAVMADTLETERLLGTGYSVRLRYQGNHEGSGRELDWSDSWVASSNLPLAVQLEIAGDALLEGPVLRTILLETAGMGEENP